MTAKHRAKIDCGRVATAAAVLDGAAPADALEAMLAEQMAAVHAAALRALDRAAECREHPQIEALHLRQAARLMHLFVRQAEALDRRRGNAEKREMERTWEAERRARITPSDPREAEERERVLRRFLPDPPPRRRRGNGEHAEGGPGAGTGAANGRGPAP